MASDRSAKPGILALGVVLMIIGGTCCTVGGLAYYVAKDHQAHSLGLSPENQEGNDRYQDAVGNEGKAIAGLGTGICLSVIGLMLFVHAQNARAMSELDLIRRSILEEHHHR